MSTRSFSESVELAVPAKFAYDFLTDVSTGTLIDPMVVSFAPDSLPFRIGTRIKICFRMCGLCWRMEAVVEALIEARRFAVRVVNPTWPVQGWAMHAWEPTPRGCIYTWAMEFRSQGLVGRVLLPMVNRSFRANAVARHRLVKAEVERRFRLNGLGRRAEEVTARPTA